SAVRNSMKNGVQGFTVSDSWLEHGYKELHIPPAVGKTLEKNALHIWPRHRFMMIALPNFDGSFTCTLFLNHRSEPAAVATGSNAATTLDPSFAQLTDETSLLDFFNGEFPDAVPLMPSLVDDFF